jgi:hypothetical protein
MAAGLDPQHVSAPPIAAPLRGPVRVVGRGGARARARVGEICPVPARWVLLDCERQGFPNMGRHSVGVVRQYCGQLGMQDNRQVAVSLSLASTWAACPSRASCTCLRTGPLMRCDAKQPAFRKPKRSPPSRPSPWLRYAGPSSKACVRAWCWPTSATGDKTAFQHSSLPWPAVCGGYPTGHHRVGYCRPRPGVRFWRFTSR